MSKASETRDRARLEILNHITQFCLSRKWPGAPKSPGYHAFVSDIDATNKPQVGDLVAIQSAPPSKFYLGWLDEIERGNETSFTRYLIRSIEDDSLCWWSNVGIDYLDREVLAEHPSWKWTDRQFAFKDRWWRVCFKERDAYMVLPVFPTFGEGFSVTLGTRERWGGASETPKLPRRSFSDWRKVTKAQMAQCYDECVAESQAKAA